MSPEDVQTLKVGERVELDLPPESPFEDASVLHGTVIGTTGYQLQVTWDNVGPCIVTIHGWRRLRREGAM